MSKKLQAIELVFPDGILEDLSENETIIAELSAKNEALISMLHDSLTDIHLMDRRITNLLADLLEWNHEGDAEEAKALYGRNEYILGQVVDLIEEHISIANLPLAEIETAFNQSDDRIMKKVLNAIHTKVSDTTDPEFVDLFQQALGVTIDFGRLNDDFEPYGLKHLNPTAIRGHQSDLNPTDLSPENVKTVGLFVHNNSIALEEINGELNNPTAASAAVIGDANNSRVDCSIEHIALASPTQASGLCESQPDIQTNGAAKRKRKPRKHEEPDYKHIMRTDRIPRHWQEIHVQLWENLTVNKNKKSTGKASFGGKITIESRSKLITGKGITTPKVILDSYCDFTKRENFRRYLNRLKKKHSKKPTRLIDDPWYEELNRLMLWLNQTRVEQGATYEALVSTAHIRVPRTKADKQGKSSPIYHQFDIKDSEHVALILLLNDLKMPVRILLLHGGKGYWLDDIWEADGKDGSSDWRATWNSPL
jgi:hypothetical protein